MFFLSFVSGVIYRYGLYSHRLIAPNGEVYTRHFIVVKNQFGLNARFTRLHNYVGVYEGKEFTPLVSDAETKLRYVCMMLNYVLIEHYETFYSILLDAVSWVLLT